MHKIKRLNQQILLLYLIIQKNNQIENSIKRNQCDSDKISANQWNGEEFDKESGLYYYNARYYDPKAGIFITPDPAMSGLNHYAYAECNPIKFTDPTGLEGYGGPSGWGGPTGAGLRSMNDTSADAGKGFDQAACDASRAQAGLGSSIDTCVDGKGKAASDTAGCANSMNAAGVGYDGRLGPVSYINGIAVGIGKGKAEWSFHFMTIDEAIIKNFERTRKTWEYIKNTTPDKFFVSIRIVRDWAFSMEDRSKNTLFNAKLEILDNRPSYMININANPIVLASFPVQSWADEIGYFSNTLDYGKYIGIFIGNITNWEMSIKFIDIKIVWNTFIHPNAFTTTNKDIMMNLLQNKHKLNQCWSTPHSQACQILQLANFNTMMYNLKGEIGFYNGNTININITNFWCTR